MGFPEKNSGIIVFFYQGNINIVKTSVGSCLSHSAMTASEQGYS